MSSGPSPPLPPLTALPPIRRNVRNESLPESDLLHFPWGTANVHHEPVDLEHPHQRVVVQTARQGPDRVKLVNPQHLSDGRQLRGPAALADAETGVDLAEPHVGCLAFVVEAIYPANRAHDAAA